MLGQCSWNVRRQGMPARQPLNRNRFVVCSCCYRVTDASTTDAMCIRDVVYLRTRFSSFIFLRRDCPVWNGRDAPAGPSRRDDPASRAPGSWSRSWPQEAGRQDEYKMSRIPIPQFDHTIVTTIECNYNHTDFNRLDFS